MKFVLALLTLTVLAGCGASAPEASAPPPAPTAVAPSAKPAPDETPKPVPVPQLQPVAVAPARRPARLEIPSIKVGTGLEMLGIGADRTIDVPKNPALAGWLQGGPAPGDPGPAIVAGHVDSKNGPAVFYRLAELKVGAIVTVRRGDRGVVRFRVDSVEQFAKATFPTARVYGPTPVPSLRLITCAGTYDRQSGYRDNIVVFASKSAD